MTISLLLREFSRNSVNWLNRFTHLLNYFVASLLKSKFCRQKRSKLGVFLKTLDSFFHEIYNPNRFTATIIEYSDNLCFWQGFWKFFMKIAK